MQRSSCTLAFGLAILLCGVAGPVEAVPITYTLSATATGTIGGSTFTNALVTWTLLGDTDNVVFNPEFEEDGVVVPAGIVFANASLGTTVNIAGIGIATLVDPSAIYSITIPVDLDEDGDIDPPGIVVGTLDNPPDVFPGFTGLGATLHNDLLDYDLRTAIGPITGFGGIGYPEGLSVVTSRGALSFSANIASEPSTFTATVSKVPEPGSLLLLGTGLVSLVGARSRLRGRHRTGTSH